MTHDEIIALKQKYSVARDALLAVSVDAIECAQAETKQYFISEWAMKRVTEALKYIGSEKK
jgi:hypothetical protein